MKIRRPGRVPNAIDRKGVEAVFQNGPKARRGGGDGVPRISSIGAGYQGFG